MHGENFSSDVKVTRCVELKDVPIQFIHENIVSHLLHSSERLYPDCFTAFDRARSSGEPYHGSVGRQDYHLVVR